MPRAPSEKVTQAEKLFNDGMAMVEIAKKLEVSDGTVRSWKNRYGWGKASKKNKCNVAKKMRRKMQRCKRKRGEVNPKSECKRRFWQSKPKPSTRQNKAWRLCSCIYGCVGFR